MADLSGLSDDELKKYSSWLGGKVDTKTLSDVELNKFSRAVQGKDVPSFSPWEETKSAAKTIFGGLVSAPMKFENPVEQAVRTTGDIAAQWGMGKAAHDDAVRRGQTSNISDSRPRPTNFNDPKVAESIIRESVGSVPIVGPGMIQAGEDIGTGIAKYRKGQYEPGLIGRGAGSGAMYLAPGAYEAMPEGFRSGVESIPGRGAAAFRAGTKELMTPPDITGMGWPGKLTRWATQPSRAIPEAAAGWLLHKVGVPALAATPLTIAAGQLGPASIEATKAFFKSPVDTKGLTLREEITGKPSAVPQGDIVPRPVKYGRATGSGIDTSRFKLKRPSGGPSIQEETVEDPRAVYNPNIARKYRQESSSGEDPGMSLPKKGGGTNIQEQKVEDPRTGRTRAGAKRRFGSERGSIKFTPPEGGETVKLEQSRDVGGRVQSREQMERQEERVAEGWDPKQKPGGKVSPEFAKQLQAPARLQKAQAMARHWIATAKDADEIYNTEPDKGLSDFLTEGAGYPKSKARPGEDPLQTVKLAKEEAIKILIKSGNKPKVAPPSAQAPNPEMRVEAPPKPEMKVEAPKSPSQSPTFIDKFVEDVKSGSNPSNNLANKVHHAFRTGGERGAAAALQEIGVTPEISETILRSLREGSQSGQ